jgi:hypothetical protein
LPEYDNNKRISIDTFIYDAPHKALHVGQVQQYKTINKEQLISLKNININRLNTDAFVLSQQLKAGMISCNGGIITIYKNGSKTKSKNREINISSDLINTIEVDGMNLNKTKIVFIDTLNSKEKPFVLNDVQFAVSAVNNVTDGSKISDIINNATWQLSVGSFSFITKDNLYSIVVDGVHLDNVKMSVGIKNIKVTPQLSQKDFVKQSKHQHDQFDLTFNDIALQGVNFKKFISNNVLEVTNASLQPIIKVFNDRTLPPDTSTKVGKYPNQQLSTMQFPFYVKKLQVKNGSVAYTEKSKKSLKAGTVFFNNINATLNNITDIKEKIKANELLTMNATALFMGKG